MDSSRFQGPVPAHLLPAAKEKSRKETVAVRQPPAPPRPTPGSAVAEAKAAPPAILFAAPPEPERQAETTPRKAGAGDLAARGAELAAQGKPAGTIAAELGISRRRAQRFVVASEGAGGLCACGREWRHVGACRGHQVPAAARAGSAAWTKTEAGRAAARKRARAMQAARTPEERSAAIKALHASRSPEEESAIATRAAETRVRRLRRSAADIEAGVRRAGRKARLEQQLGTGGFVCVYVAGGEAPLAEEEVLLLVRLGVLMRQFERRQRKRVDSGAAGS